MGRVSLASSICKRHSWWHRGMAYLWDSRGVASCLPAYLPAYLPACLLACLHACLLRALDQGHKQGRAVRSEESGLRTRTSPVLHSFPFPSSHVPPIFDRLTEGSIYNFYDGITFDFVIIALQIRIYRTYSPLSLISPPSATYSDIVIIHLPYLPYHSISYTPSPQPV
jgi:hypothetical protein